MTQADQFQEPKLTWWIISTMTLFLVGILATNFQMVISQGSRISALEAHQEETRSQLQRIETKLETVLQFERERRLRP